MSRRNKLKKFSELLALPNVYENFDVETPDLVVQEGTEVQMKGQWHKKHFKNGNPLILELACGRGEYTVSLARSFPDRNFIGVDIKGARIWKGARIAHEEKLHNAAFLRTRIEYLHNFFEKEEVAEIWITFPDPFSKRSKANRRLTSPFFLNIYRKVLKEEGIVHLKTDEAQLHAYTLAVIAEEKQCALIENIPDIYAGLRPPYEELAIQTYYERMHLRDGRTIRYVQFKIGLAYRVLNRTIFHIEPKILPKF